MSEKDKEKATSPKTLSDLDKQLKSVNPNHNPPNQVNWNDVLFPHQKQQAALQRKLQENPKKSNFKPIRRRSRLPVGLGVITMGCILALANSGLADGETLGNVTYVFAFAAGLVVIIATRKVGL